MWVQCVCLLLSAWVTAIAADPTYLSDLAILEQAIASSAAKVAAAESRSTDLLNTADLLSDSFNTITGFDISFNLFLSSLRDDLENVVEIPAFELEEGVQNMTQAVARSRSRADGNRARHRTLSGELAKLQENNRVQNGQLAKLSDLLSRAANTQSEIYDEKSAAQSTLALNHVSIVSVAVAAVAQTKCYFGEVVVNVTSGEGSETLSYPHGLFNSLLTTPVPTTYCAISGLVSTIDEEQPAAGYGQIASSREQTGFSVSCQSTESGADVIVIDRSRSERGLNKFLEVTVQIKACNFNGVGLDN